MNVKRLSKIFSILFGVSFFAVVIGDWVINSTPMALTLFFAFTFFAMIGLFVVEKGLVPYTFKRILGSLVTLFVIASATFFMLRLLPGGPFDKEKTLPPKIKAHIEAKYNLDKSIMWQYGDYMFGLMKGDLGESYKYLGRPVRKIIGECLPASFKLGFYALILSFLIGIPLGVLAAAKHNTWLDQVSMISAISGVALPNFVVAALLVYVFAMQLNWFPPALWSGPLYYVLPVVTLGVRPAAVLARLTRASVLEVISSDYIRTAKAKGLSGKRILFQHVLQNSLIPVLSIAGPLVAGVLAGSFIIEICFAVPGMGKHLVQSVTNRDYPLILALTLLYSTLLVFANLIVDLLYAYFDPRMKLS